MLESARFTESAKKLLWAGAEATATKLSNMLGTSIHAPAQLEWFKNTVDDKSIHVGGRQYIQTRDGYTIPLDIVSGLARVSLRPFTDHE
jgi:hypothetical protein